MKNSEQQVISDFIQQNFELPTAFT